MAADRLREIVRRRAGAVRVRTTLAAVAVVGVALVIGAAALVAGLHAALVREVRASATLQAADAARTLAAGGDPVAAVAGMAVFSLSFIRRTH